MTILKYTPLATLNANLKCEPHVALHKRCMLPAPLSNRGLEMGRLFAPVNPERGLGYSPEKYLMPADDL
ncbi:MAG: hypothetical protein ACREX3_01450 [Gammaproteobacteria bacterium]